MIKDKRDKSREK